MSPQSAVEGRYLLDAALDRWGVGEAWQARDKNFRNRPVVLEFFAADRADVALERSHEIRAQRALKHACVLPVINQGTHEGRPWVAFDGFEGISLARYIDEERRGRAQLDRATAEDLFDKVLDGVSAAHEGATAVLHGCLSARSVLVKQGALKVIDFALGALASPEVLGPYRAPELARPGEPVSIASDVYALGVLLADMLMPQNVGDARKALEGLLAGLTRDGAQAGRMQRHDIPPAAWDVVARAVRRDPSTRWDDVASMRKALQAAWATAPAPAPAPSVSSALAQALRAPTMSMPSAPPRPATVAMPPAMRSAPAQPAFSGPMPPVAPAFTAAPAPQPPAFSHAPFSAPPPFVSPPQPPPPPAWNAPPPPPGASSDAWSTLKPAGHTQARAALASAWDAPAPSPPGPAPASIASAWDAGEVNPDWAAPPSYVPPLAAPLAPAPGAPVAGAISGADDDWEDETRASADHPMRASAPAPIAPAGPSKALQNKLNEMARQESTMALDLDSLNAAAGVAASRAVAATTPLSDDWKEGVVLLDTSPASSLRAVDEDEEEPYEPGSRTQVAHAPAPVLDTMETLRPMQRPVALEPFVPRIPGMSGPVDAESTFVANSPLVPEAPPRPLTMASVPLHAQPVALPPVSERTMAIDTSGGPHDIGHTMPAPMGMMGAPRPFTPPVAQPVERPVAAPSKLPIIVAVVIALVLIAGALAVVATRR
ncbi:MAG: hypothetical protein U0326_37095 [Polyangiales bacterium]